MASSSLHGNAPDICVLFTANDAYMRDFNLIVPQDGVASNTDAINRAALDEMRQVLKADTRSAGDIDWAILLGDESRPLK